MRYTAVLSLAALALVAACGSESPTEVSANPAVSASDELVITEGAAAPAQKPRASRPSLSAAAAAANAGGSTTTPLSLKPQSCESNGQQVEITYTITGRQDNPASFQVNTLWTYNGTSWSGTTPTTVSVAPRAANDPATVKKVTIKLVNGSTASTGTSAVVIQPSNLVTSAPAALAITNANVTVNIAFAACPVTNRDPVLTLPSDFSVEATSSAGAAVTYVVSASDPDGDAVIVNCSPASGATFPLGATPVTCTASDGKGGTASGGFTITVVDTTPAEFTSFPSGTISLVAANINGAVLDLDAQGITVADVGGVSEPSTFSCDYVAGTKLAIGSTTTVSCTAKDAIGNESAASTFDVFVGLDVSGIGGFLSPLRMAAPFSAHKRGSTIPHKFLAPKYADGTPATDLAGDLRLVINRLDGTVETGDVEVNDYTAGSTTWRYDPDAGQYIFNLKTQTAWDQGTWKTTVSYKGIELATTRFDLKK
ncbi:MAG TPA: PxKF domain-containing protein [Gemmatimonadales bacterium]|nr:PxKF domain-containing protein [Gemmatimonadales bacterium]